MKNAKHTPEPWNYELNDDTIYWQDEDGNRYAICKIDEQDDYEHQQANARLLLAAPKLLACLEKMATMAMHAPLIGHDYDQSDIDDAMAVIAQVKGESDA